MVCQQTAFLIFTLLLMTRLVGGCLCPPATVLSRFPSEVPADACCLNYSGSVFGQVPWSLFTNETNIEILDLSFCNVTSVDVTDKEMSGLQKVYLNNNRLMFLPDHFLSGQQRLTEVDLSENAIQELPDGFLQDSENLQELYLQGNELHFLPGSILQKPKLQKLELHGNPWECSCLFLEGLEGGKKLNKTTKLEDLLGRLTCVSPGHLAGRTVLSVSLSDVCRPAGLTALFILLPLLTLSALVLCWCCGRKKDPPVITSKKKVPSSSYSAQKHKMKQQPGSIKQKKVGLCASDGNLETQLHAHPASTTLGSSRDLYQEEEIKLGSAESIPQASARYSRSTEGKRVSHPDGASKTELDAVSVTEVMQDSAAREKAYLAQSTKYYSLVPGLELDDSDQGEYQTVPVSWQHLEGEVQKKGVWKKKERVFFLLNQMKNCTADMFVLQPFYLFIFFGPGLKMQRENEAIWSWDQLSVKREDEEAGKWINVTIGLFFKKIFCSQQLILNVTYFIFVRAHWN